MDREALAKEHPELVASLINEGREAGANAERARIQAVEAQSMPGHEKLIASLKFDGKTTGPEAAVQVLAAEKAARTTRAAAIVADAPAPVPHAAPAEGTPSTPAQALPLAERAKQEWEKSAQLQGEFGSLSAYVAYLKNTEAGNARVLSRK